MAGCGGGADLKDSAGKRDATKPPPGFESVERSLGSVRAEIMELAAPEGVSEGDFEILKSELLKQLEARGLERLASTAPSGESGLVEDLMYDGASQTLYWSYVNLGDFDVNGVVGVADITPIALNYLAARTGEEWQDAYLAWVDGDGSGQIGIPDITPIALNYLNTVAEYVVLTSSSESGPFTEIARVPFASGEAPSETEKIPLTFRISPLPEGAQKYIAVAPADGEGTAGVHSVALDWLASSQISCVHCHTNKQMIIDTAEPEEPNGGEEEGET